MDLKIVEEKENKPLGRIEIVFGVEDAAKTPSRTELRKRIAALKNSKEELVSIDCVNQCFGEHRALGKAFVYSDIEQLKRIEPRFLIERETKEKKPKKKKPEEKEAKAEEGKGQWPKGKEGREAEGKKEDAGKDGRKKEENEKEGKKEETREKGERVGEKKEGTPEGEEEGKSKGKGVN